MTTTRQLQVAKSTAASPPSTLADGEFGLRTYNGVSYLYIGTSSGNVLLASSSKITKLLEEKAGIEAFSSGVSTVTVSFSTSFSSINYVPTFSIINTVNGVDAAQYSYTVTAQSVDGFTVKIGGLTDTANYKLAWRAIEV